MKIFDKISDSNLFDVIYHTILFTVVSIIILNIIYVIPAQILKTFEENIYYTLLKGASWIIISIIVGLIFGVEYRKEDVLRHNERDVSSNLLYILILMLTIVIISGLIGVMGEYFFPEDAVAYMQNISEPAIGNYESVLGKMIFIIALLISAILNATGEELFIRYIAYKKLAKKNSGRELNYKFIVATSLAFGLYHGIGIFFSLSKGMGFIRFLGTFTISVGICFVFLRTKSIVYAIIMHALWNFIILSSLNSLVISFFEKILTSGGDSSYIETLSIASIYLVLILLVMIYRVFKSRFYRRING